MKIKRIIQRLLRWGSADISYMSGRYYVTIYCHDSTNWPWYVEDSGPRLKKVLKRLDKSIKVMQRGES